MDNTEKYELELTQALDEITALLPSFSYTRNGSKLSVQLTLSQNQTAPPIENYLAAKGILFRFPFLKELFPVFVDVSAADLANIHNAGAACPCHAKSCAKTCPALRGSECSLAAAACPWKPCKVTHKRATQLLRPHDKLVKTIFDSKTSISLERDTIKEEHGRIKSEPNGRKPVNIEVGIKLMKDLEESGSLSYSRSLDPLDRRIHAILFSLQEADNTFITPGMVAIYLHGSSEYNAKQLEEIAARIEKMQRTWISIDNHQEIEAGYRYPKYKESGMLIPWRTCEVEYRGQYCKAYAVTEKLPLPRFAQGRNQISTQAMNTLLTAGKKTVLQVGIEEYLLDQIANQTYCTLKIETLYTHFNVTNNKKRFLGRVEKALQHFVSTKNIASFAIREGKIIWTK